MHSNLRDAPSYDLWRADVRSDPYPIYEQVRACAPAVWCEPLGVWLVGRHGDVLRMLKDPVWSSNYFNSVLDDEQRATMEAEQRRRVLLFLDGPEHLEIRRALSKSITTAMLADFAAQARLICEELLRDLSTSAEVDLIANFASPLPLRMLAKLIGIPASDLPTIAASALELAQMVDWKPTPDVIDSAGDKADALVPYFFELLKHKRSVPADDLLSHLVLEARARRIRYPDIIGACLLILAAGQMTSTHMIGNGTLALLRDDQARREFTSGSADTWEVVDELLRYDSPVQVTPRAALANVPLGDQVIPRGALVLGLLGSANRDPGVFHRPERLDFARKKSDALSFGAGSHFCFGARFARILGKTAFESLFLRYPGIELVSQALAWQPTITQRGLCRLQVVLGKPDTSAPAARA